jgi:hypothetical protein
VIIGNENEVLIEMDKKRYKEEERILKERGY